MSDIQECATLTPPLEYADRALHWVQWDTNHPKLKPTPVVWRRSGMSWRDDHGRDVSDGRAYQEGWRYLGPADWRREQTELRAELEHEVKFRLLAEQFDERLAAERAEHASEVAFLKNNYQRLAIEKNAAAANYDAAKIAAFALQRRVMELEKGPPNV